LLDKVTFINGNKPGLSQIWSLDKASLANDQLHIIVPVRAERKPEVGNSEVASGGKEKILGFYVPVEPAMLVYLFDS
jgi:hypothetical protein